MTIDRAALHAAHDTFVEIVREYAVPLNDRLGRAFDALETAIDEAPAEPADAQRAAHRIARGGAVIYCGAIGIISNVLQEHAGFTPEEASAEAIRRVDAVLDVFEKVDKP